MSFKSTVGMIALVALLGGGANAALKITANVAGASALSPGIPFKDCMWQSNGWNWAELDDYGERPGFFGGTDRYPWPVASVPKDDIMAAAPLNENNYPAEVPFTYNGTQYRPVYTPFFWFLPVSLLPMGTYTFIGEGTGVVELGWEKDVHIELNGGVTVVEIELTSPNMANTFENETFNATMGTKTSGWCLTIRESDASDPVRNIHFIRPDHEGGTSWVDDFEECPFDPQWLESHRIYNSLRYMGYGTPNSNNSIHWDDRTKPTDAPCPDREREQTPYAEAISWATPYHIPWEYQIKMSNGTGVDAWLTIPSKADSNYVVQLANLVYDMLDPDLNVYVEWGNETWNPIFYSLHQQQYVQNNYNSAANTNEKAHAYMACRNTGIFEDVFGADEDRVFGVVAGFINGTGVGDAIVNAVSDPAINPNDVTIDCYAIGCYFGSQGPDAGRVGAAVSTANRGGMRCLIYEGGTEGGRSPAMYNLITSALNTLDGTGVENFNAFVAVDGWGQFGDWGFMLHNEQPLDSAYKYKALYDWVIDHGQYTEGPIPGCGGSSVNDGIRSTYQTPAVQPASIIAGNADVYYDVRGRRIVGAGAGAHTAPQIRIRADQNKKANRVMTW